MTESTVESLIRGAEPAEPRQQQGVRSVETAGHLLRALARLRDHASLKDIAEAADLAPAKAHRYLVSLGRAGLVEQDRETGHYRLGRTALEIGLSALGGLDVMRFAGETLQELRAAIDETVLLAVWGDAGAVVVRWEESARPVTTNVRVGSVMPLLNSATGRTFAAFLPEAATAERLAAETARAPALAEGYDTVIAETREHGLGRVDGDLLPGVSSLAAPVFNQQGEVEAVIAAVGYQGVFDSSRDGPVAQQVRQAAAGLSARLGYFTASDA